jgi:hypothetical protein
MMLKTSAAAQRRGGNITGFMNFEYGISGKWLQLLKEIAARATRVAIIRELSNPSGLGHLVSSRVQRAIIGRGADPDVFREELDQGAQSWERGKAALRGTQVLVIGRCALARGGRSRNAH